MPANSRKHQVRTLVIRVLLSSALLLTTLPVLSQGQITLDGSLGPRGPLAGPNYRVGADLGQIRGSNLFHSFGQFNVQTGESASFTGPNTIANIVGRVTGGQQSFIDGRLRSEIAGANLFLLNPSGVLFGQHASLDVSGSFHVSTADFLRFADGAKFSAHLGQESVLTVAPPTAFGFLGNNPAAITIQGSRLRVNDGKTVSVVGGDITMVGGSLQAPSGRLQLASVASPGEAVFSRLELATDLQVDNFARLGRLELSQGALLDASGVGIPGSGGPGGTVLIRSGRLMFDRSAIFANNLGNVDGTGLGVDIGIAADAVITHQAFITTDGLGAGRARALRLTAGSVDIDGSLIGSAGPFGTTGNTEVRGERVMLTGGGRIISSTTGPSRGGDVTVVATDAISISGRDSSGRASGLFSNTFFSSGDAGRLFVSAPTLTMEGGFIQASAALGRGNLRELSVETGRLTLTGGAIIGSLATGSGKGGNVTVSARESVSISDPTSGIASFAAGDPGRLSLSAPTVSINGGAIGTSSAARLGFVGGRGGILQSRQTVSP